jgi:hypothetical protein
MEGKKQKRLTVSQLRSFKGLENLSEEEAEAGIATLEKLSVLFYELFQKKLIQDKEAGKGKKDVKKNKSTPNDETK